MITFVGSGRLTHGKLNVGGFYNVLRALRLSASFRTTIAKVERRTGSG